MEEVTIEAPTVHRSTTNDLISDQAHNESANLSFRHLRAKIILAKKSFEQQKQPPCKSETRRRQAKNRGQPDCRSKLRRFQGIKQQSGDETNMKAKQVKSRSISLLNQGLRPHRHGRFSKINQLYWFGTVKAKSSRHQQKLGNEEWTDNATLTPKCRKISEFIRSPSDTTARGCSI